MSTGLLSQRDWEEQYGTMPIGDAFDAAKKAPFDFFAHEAKKATKEEFLSAVTELGISTLTELWNTIEEKNPVDENADRDTDEVWPVDNPLHFNQFSQSVNDAMQAVAEWARSLFSKVAIGVNVADL